MFCGVAARAQTGAASAPVPETLPRVAVAGFEPADGCDPRDHWIGLGFEEALSRRLLRIPHLQTLPPMLLHQAALELADTPDAKADWARVAALLGANHRVSGRFAGPPDAVRIELTLHAGAAPPQSTQLGPAALFEVLDAATRWVVAHCGAPEPTGDAATRLFAPPCRTPTALEHFCRALTAIRADNARDAGYYLEQSLAFDALFRPAQLLAAQLDLRRTPDARAGAVARLRQVAVLAQQAEDIPDQIETELLLGIAALGDRSFEAAEIRLTAALAEARRHRLPYAEVVALNNLADLHLNRAARPDRPPTASAPGAPDRGPLEAALSRQQEVVSALKALGDQIALIPATNKLALIHEQLGNEADSLAAHEATLAAAQRCGATRSAATSWMFLGQAHRRAGRAEQARDALAECLKLAPAAARPTVRLLLADAEQALGRPQDALRELEAAYAEIREGDDLVSQLRCLRSLAELRHAVGQRAEALQALRDARDVAHALQLPDVEAIDRQLAEWQRVP